MTTLRTIALGVAAAAALLTSPVARASDASADRDHVQRQALASAQVPSQAAREAPARASAERPACHCAKC